MTVDIVSGMHMATACKVFPKELHSFCCFNLTMKMRRIQACHDFQEISLSKLFSEFIMRVSSASPTGGTPGHSGVIWYFCGEIQLNFCLTCGENMGASCSLAYYLGEMKGFCSLTRCCLFCDLPRFQYEGKPNLS